MLDEPGYNELKAHLTIDPTRMTEELIQIPQYQQDAAEGTAEAQLIRDNAKDALEVAKANAAADLRYATGAVKQPAENTIASEISLNPAVQTAMEGLREAEYDLGLWKSLADGLKTKYNAMSKITDLIVSGYTTPDAIYSDRRTKPQQVAATVAHAAINEQRRKLSRE